MVDVGDNCDIAQALLAAHYESTVLGRAASEYPNQRDLTSVEIMTGA